MKPAFLVVSLLVNVAFAIGLMVRPTLAPPAVRDFLKRHFHAAEATPAIARKPEAPKERSKLWPTLQTDDLRQMIQRLREAGFPANIIREIIRAEVDARYRSRFSAIQDSDSNVPFWKQKPTFFVGGSKRFEQLNQLQRERTKLLRDLLSDDFFAGDDTTAAQRRQYGSLSRAKIDQVQRIEDDYAEMNSAIRAATNGITLPEDREKLALLAREKSTDLAAVLTPEELADYEMRSSPIIATLRYRIGDFDPTEAEFKALYQLQKSMSGKFSDTDAFSAMDYQARQDVLKDYHDQLRAAFGDTRYAEYVRETSSDYQQLSRLTQAANLPRETAVQAYNLRDAVAQESSRIVDDGSLTPDEKRAALQTLASNIRAQLIGILGQTAGSSYVKIADQWLSMVEKGNAVIFDSANSFMIVTPNGSISSSGWPRFRNVAQPRLAGRTSP